MNNIMTTMTTTATCVILLILACMTHAWMPSCSVIHPRNKSILRLPAATVAEEPLLFRTKLSLLRASTSSSSSSSRSSSSSTTTTSSTTTAAAAASTSETSATNIQEHAIILDGAEWASVHRHLKRQQQQQQQQIVELSKSAILNIITARNNKGESIIGLRVMTDQASTAAADSYNNYNYNTTVLSPDISVYTDSIAIIPSGHRISIQDAVRTYPYIWTCVQTMLPNPQDDSIGIGGAAAGGAGAPSSTEGNNNNNNNNTNNYAFHRCVVLGGNEHACMAATALNALGCQVTLVTTTGKPAMPLDKKIHVIEPAVGDVGFAQFVNKFDALLDTVGNELDGDIDDDDDDDDKQSSFAMPSANSVLRLLEKRHDCTQYASTRTHQEAIIGKEGLLFGPGKAKKYVPSSKSVIYPPPPRQLGDTVQRLFQAGIVWPAKAVPTRTVELFNNNNNSGRSRQATLRGWTLNAYWESTTWPRDSNGSGNTRYGLPVIDDSEFIAPLLDAPYAQVEAPPMPFERVEADVPQEYNTKSSSFVLQVHGVKGLQEHIVDSELDCVLFLSAPYCRTCNRINPFYQRMARVNEQEQQNEKGDSTEDEIPITFCRADATGLAGKELGRHLNINAVPTFVLFKKGKQYGFPLAISRLPSKKLERAIAYLKQGRTWDDDAFLDEEGTGRRTQLT